MNAETAIAGGPPRWILMWLLAGALFFAGKTAMLRHARLRGWRRMGFVLFWIGMDADAFSEKVRREGTSHPLPLGWPAWNVTLGVILIWGIARFFEHPLAAGWIGMIG